MKSFGIYVYSNFDGAVLNIQMKLELVLWSETQKGEVMAEMFEKIPMSSSIVVLQILATQMVVCFVHEINIRNVFSREIQISLSMLFDMMICFYLLSNIL